MEWMPFCELFAFFVCEAFPPFVRLSLLPIFLLSCPSHLQGSWLFPHQTTFCKGSLGWILIVAYLHICIFVYISPIPKTSCVGHLSVQPAIMETTAIIWYCKSWKRKNQNICSNRYFFIIIFVIRLLWYLCSENIICIYVNDTFHSRATRCLLFEV